MVREFLRENRDRLGEMHLGYGIFEEQEEELANVVVAKVEELFVQI